MAAAKREIKELEMKLADAQAENEAIAARLVEAQEHRAHAEEEDRQQWLKMLLDELAVTREKTPANVTCGKTPRRAPRGPCVRCPPDASNPAAHNHVSGHSNWTALSP